VNRNLAVAIAVIVAAVIGVRLSQEDGSESRAGCDGVRDAVAVLTGVEESGTVPTAAVYDEAARSIRRAAVTAPAGVSPDLHAVADSYGQLGILFQGFDPADPSTYGIIEQRTPEIEREEARLDEASARVTAWLQATCG